VSQTPGKQPGQPATEEQGKLAMERAEDLVDRFGQRLGHFTALVGFQIQKATARVREEANDMWAEAQNVRQRRSRPPH
jgi:hypothetical protein